MSTNSPYPSRREYASLGSQKTKIKEVQETPEVQERVSSDFFTESKTTNLVEDLEPEMFDEVPGKELPSFDEVVFPAPIPELREVVEDEVVEEDRKAKTSKEKKPFPWAYLWFLLFLVAVLFIGFLWVFQPDFFLDRYPLIESPLHVDIYSSY